MEHRSRGTGTSTLGRIDLGPSFTSTPLTSSSCTCGIVVSPPITDCKPPGWLCEACLDQMIDVHSMDALQAAKLYACHHLPNSLSPTAALNKTKPQDAQPVPFAVGPRPLESIRRSTHPPSVDEEQGRTCTMLYAPQLCEHQKEVRSSKAH